MHSFSESLKNSHKASDLPLWEETYRKAFFNFQTMVDHRQNGEHQKAGIDRSIILENSKQILIDEKVRGRNKDNGKVYTDILLEFLSDRDRCIPGWVCKPLRADYIAYAIGPLGICYLLPVPQLQAAWRKYGAIWKNVLPIIKSFNTDWVTLSVAIEVPKLFSAIGEQLRITFNPTEIP